MTKRIISAPTGDQLQAKSWLTEAPLRMLMNNLDTDVAERPDELVVYGGIGKAARDWEAFDRIVDTLKELGGDETLPNTMCLPPISNTRSGLRDDRVNVDGAFPTISITQSRPIRTF